MFNQTYDIAHPRGDTFVRTYAFKDQDGVPIDLTGSSLKFSIKKELSETVPLVTANATISNPTTGIAVVNISDTVMQTLTFIGIHYYDIQWTDSLWVVRTPKRWIFYNVYDVSPTA